MTMACRSFELFCGRDVEKFGAVGKKALECCEQSLLGHCTWSLGDQHIAFMQTVRVAPEVLVEDRNLLGTELVVICVTSGKNLTGLCTTDSGVLKMSGMWGSWKQIRVRLNSKLVGEFIGWNWVQGSLVSRVPHDCYLLLLVRFAVSSQWSREVWGVWKWECEWVWSVDRAAVDEAVVTANQKRKCPARGATWRSQEAMLHRELPLWRT